MSTPTNPAYDYGRLLGTIAEAARRMVEQINKGISDARRNVDAPMPADPLEAREIAREIARERAYRRRIEEERRAGRAFVRSKARQVVRDTPWWREDI